MSDNHPILPFSRIELDSGLRLLHKEVRAAPIVAISVWVQAGGATERPEELGISHFLEHMFFKGTERHPVGEMDLLVKSFGGYNNAATSYDYTQYYIVLPADRFEDAYDVLVDAFLYPTFPEDEISREREVVIEEIRRKEDSPTSKLYSDFIQSVFGGTPYGMEILGTEESLRAIGRKELIDYHRRRYAVDQTIVSIAGDIPLEKARAATERLFASFSRNGGEPPPVAAVPSLEPRELEIRKDVQQSYAVWGYPIPCVIGEPEEYALDVAAAILSEGRSSRLYQLLRERESLVSSFQAFFWTLKGAALFGMEATTVPGDRERVEAIMRAELRNLAESLVGEAELERAKRLITAGFAFDNEKAVSLASTLGRHEIVSSAVDAVTYCDRIRAVTPEAVRDAVDRYCRPGTETRAVLLPSREAE